MQRVPSCIAPEFGTKVGSNGLRVAPNEDPQQYKAKQRRRLGDGEHILHRCAGAHSEDIQRGEKNYQQDGGKILRVQADIHVAQDHGANGDGRHVGDMNQPVRG